MEKLSIISPKAQIGEGCVIGQFVVIDDCQIYIYKKEILHTRIIQMTEDIWQKLARSAFRSKFRLSAQDKDYIEQKGLNVIYKHACDFVAGRLAPAYIANDGKQTPMRGHPVFVAQHATGCCCRGCLEEWHHIPKGRALTTEEQDYIVHILMTWIEKQLALKL